MRFVKTHEELRRVRSIYSRLHLLAARNLSVLFETKPAAVRDLLPPPLRPAPEALGLAWVGDVGNSNCVGPFRASALLIRARYEDTPGLYCLAATASTPEAATYFREVLGIPAKVAALTLERQGEHVWGSTERNGVRVMSLRCRAAEEEPSRRRETSVFTFKYLLGTDGTGFDSPPRLVLLTASTNVDSASVGRGEIVFRDSQHDPLFDVPVRQVISATSTEGQVYVSGQTLCEVDPNAFMPYAFAGFDAFEAAAEGTVMHAQAVRRSREGRGQWRSL